MELVFPNVDIVEAFDQYVTSSVQNVKFTARNWYQCLDIWVSWLVSRSDEQQNPMLWHKQIFSISGWQSPVSGTVKFYVGNTIIVYDTHTVRRRLEASRIYLHLSNAHSSWLYRVAYSRHFIQCFIVVSLPCKTIPFTWRQRLDSHSFIQNNW